MNRARLTYLAFAMYFITGVICMMIGAEMSGLVEHYQRPVESVVLIISAFAMGRAVSAYPIGRLCERYGPLKILFIGTIAILSYMMGVVLNGFFPLAFLFAFTGGIGMAVQDSTCPMLLSRAFPSDYSSSLSAGQGLYGMGGFAIAFLAGLFQSKGFPLYLTNLLLAIIGISMILLIPFTSWDQRNTEVTEEKIVPCYAKNPKLCMGILGIACLIYCAICNCMASYMTSYIEALGFPQKDASNILTLYNLFSVAGSIAFVFILKKISEKNILLINSLTATILISVMLYLKELRFYYLAMALSGFLIGVLFSIIIALATRLYYEHIAIAGATIAMTGSAGDILAPLFSSLIIRKFGISAIFNCIVLLLILFTILSLLVYCLIKEKKYGDSK